MLAHVNTAGVHIPLWIVGQAASVGWGQNPSYPNQEGTFFGDIMRTNTAGHVDAYYCNGPGFDKDVVPGRLGATQVGAPYRNLFASSYCNINGCVPSDSKTNNVPDGYKACAMGDGAMNVWNNTITVWRQNKAYDANGNVVAGKTADGGTVRYDFENGSNTQGWTSNNGALALMATSEVGAETGTMALKSSYNSGSTTARISSPSGLSIPAGTQVSFYVYLQTSSNLTSVNPFVVTNSGSTKTTVPVSNLLQGSWNLVTVTVPSGLSGSQVGVEFQASNWFYAYLDSVTW